MSAVISFMALPAVRSSYQVSGNLSLAPVRPRQAHSTTSHCPPSDRWRVDQNERKGLSLSVRNTKKFGPSISETRQRLTVRPSSHVPLTSSFRGSGLRNRQAAGSQKKQDVAMAVKAFKDDPTRGDENLESNDDMTTILASAGIFLLWAGFAAYAFTLAPNLTPYRDQYFLEKLVGLRSNDGFEMNHVLVALFNLMGVWPAVYAMVLIPTARSSKGSPPIWPFSAVSVFVGAFALLPYFALWRDAGPVPLPSAEERQSRVFKVLESKVTAVVLAVAAAVLLSYGASAGSDNWAEFMSYYRGSRFIHVMSLDFCILSAMAPFWIYNDMTVRKWEGRDTWWVVLAALPLAGPLIHLLVRPGLPEPEK